MFDSTFVAVAYSFYGHNAPLIFLGGMTILGLFSSLKKPSRANILIFAAFLILTFNFEYDKHLIAQVKSHWLDLLFPPGQRFDKYNFLSLFFSKVLPIALDIVGWGMLALAIFVLKRDRE
jgi:hypothetical protein